MKDFFKEDEYWKEHINKKIEDDMWIEKYSEYFSNKGKCLELGCGIGQYSKRIMEYGYDVTSTDISDIALAEVKKFNSNVKKVDMREKLPFKDYEFDLVFANLSIHYFDDKTTKQLIKEIKRVLKDDGLFIGTVNGTEGINFIKDSAIMIDHHFYIYKNKYIRLFDKGDLIKYLSEYEVKKIEKRKIVRFEHEKTYYIFIAQK